uniref:Uncharacterized protein n=1 Tax=Rhizophora mucronata TaxID=61149 RepID=A0A2P2NPG0_RHIMU
MHKHELYTKSHTKWNGKVNGEGQIIAPKAMLLSLALNSTSLCTHLKQILQVQEQHLKELYASYPKLLPEEKTSKRKKRRKGLCIVTK